jgi:hypothetical protein
LATGAAMCSMKLNLDELGFVGLTMM